MDVTPLTADERRSPPPLGWHTMSPESAMSAVQTEATRGLSEAAAASRLQRDGPNDLPAPQTAHPVVIFLRQFRSPLVYVLLAAAVLSLGLRHLTDAGFIGFVLVVNALLGAWQELQAERQSANLRGLLRVRATVLRDAVTREIDASQLVRGDIVVLASGDRVPADLRLCETQALEVDASMLTGESSPVAHDAALACEEHTPVADRTNCALAGTLVVRGRARGVVVATGSATEVGRIASRMTGTAAGKPPLTVRMERFSHAVAIVVLSAAVLIGCVAVLVHDQSIFTMFTFGVALAVSAIPEGLPVAVTVALAIAARRMASRGAIVRQLPAVEGLGSCSLVASDKTGTLTCNELTAVELRLDDNARWQVTGAGYRPVGEIRRVDDGARVDKSTLVAAMHIAVACNEAELIAVDGAWRTRGDPTDLALLVLAAKAGIERDHVLAQWPVVAQIAYEPERRFAASFHRRDGSGWVAVKGAPERVFDMCVLDAGQRESRERDVSAMAQLGQRVLALADGKFDAESDPASLRLDPVGLQFRALVGLIDPLREGAAAAVRRCHEAGIRVVMVTGDHPVTALAIADELGIAAGPDEVMQGSQVQLASPAQLTEAIGRVRVFARVTPEQKLAIVEAAQSAGHFVAVTGDGVNDAPALRRANIGVAMGRSGTDVARDAADLVLSDDNFTTIVAGVEEGRIAYRNIRNVVYLLTAAGIAEVVTVGLAVLAGLPLPLLPVQLLWLNLVTNGVQDVGLAFERGTGDELRAPPRPSHEPIFNRLMIQRGVLAGLWMSALGLGLFVWLLEAGRSLDEARNALLLLMVLMQNVDAINARSETISVLRLPLRNNPVLLAGVGVALGLHLAAMYLPWLQQVLSVRPPSAGDWLLLPALAVSLLVLMEAQKRWRRSRAQST
ncbi:MAG: HAD-IC family P-type ATPase [Steroidobacteraceae bacterium]|nr:HAD-IC family P-type ATPase [Steroidobacteraceae bacterium]MBP9129128.1 HAD-IC family P-type ATPase [Steroidobacteraceae bacterium]